LLPKPTDKLDWVTAAGILPNATSPGDSLSLVESGSNVKDSTDSLAENATPLSLSKRPVPKREEGTKLVSEENSVGTARCR